MIVLWNCVHISSESNTGMGHNAMVGIASTSRNHSSSIWVALRFGLCWNGSSSLIGSITRGCWGRRHCGATWVLWSCFHTLHRSWQGLKRSFRHASTSTNHSSVVSQPLRFGLWWNAGLYQSASSKQSWQRKHCDTRRVLWNCCCTYG